MNFDQQLQIKHLELLDRLSTQLTSIEQVLRTISERTFYMGKKETSVGRHEEVADGEDNYNKLGNKVAISQQQSRVSKGVGPKAPSSKKGK